MASNKFHLALCMAGSVSAGAYTAGVMDYLLEALRNWDRAKKSDEFGDRASIPGHQVVIDLLCGTSGGGMTSAMSLFAMQDPALEHVRLTRAGTFKKPMNNIFWESWVEMTGRDMFSKMLETGDIKNGYVPSGLHAGFIDEIAGRFRDYVRMLFNAQVSMPPFLCPEVELFLTLFNVTGIKYEVHSKGNSSSGKQYVSEHRDIAHFGWHKQYQGKGRIELNLDAGILKKHLAILINSAKATGAFPVGLKARKVARQAKYIYDNPFFSKGGRFNRNTIKLGDCVKTPEDEYFSLNADGGTANNEPIELAQDVLMAIRNGYYKETDIKSTLSLTNSSVILIDPFPSLNSVLTRPECKGEHLPKYAGGLIGAMRSQLLFDAKQALDAYKERNYGLHLIAPSKEGFEAAHAIACGSLGGFGGFLNYDFRVHDYFLGRHNCQSFIRKYFVADMDEVPGSKNYQCVEAVISAYRNNPVARSRFEFKDKDGRNMVPILPDVVLRKPLDVEFRYEELPEYKLNILPADFLEQYRAAMKKRYKAVIGDMFDSNFFINSLISVAGFFSKGKAVDEAIDYIARDFIERKLMTGSLKQAEKKKEDCKDPCIEEGMER